jgi:transcriptional regulator with XRE-family HTH domain
VTAVSLPFAALLKRSRLAAGLTQEALAERSGLSARAVSDLERDGERTPRLDTLALLADALGLTHERRADLFAAARPAVQPAVIGPTLTLRPDPLPAPPTTLIGREAEVAAVPILAASRPVGATLEKAGTACCESSAGFRWAFPTGRTSSKVSRFTGLRTCHLAQIQLLYSPRARTQAGWGCRLLGDRPCGASPEYYRRS